MVASRGARRVLLSCLSLCVVLLFTASGVGVKRRQGLSEEPPTTPRDASGSVDRGRFEGGIRQRLEAARSGTPSDLGDPRLLKTLKRDWGQGGSNV